MTTDITSTTRTPERRSRARKAPPELTPEAELLHLGAVDSFLEGILRTVRRASVILDEEVRGSDGTPDWERCDRALVMLAEARLSLRMCRQNELRPVLEHAKSGSAT